MHLIMILKSFHVGENGNCVEKRDIDFNKIYDRWIFKSKILIIIKIIFENDDIFYSMLGLMLYNV